MSESMIVPGKSFLFKDLIDFEKGKAVKKQVLSNEAGTSIMLVAMDEASLPDHPAPSDAILTVLDGEGELVYEGAHHKLHHGMSFAFAKGAIHSVTTDKKLRFMLLFY